MFLISCFPNDRIKVKWSRPKWFYVTPAHSSQNFIFNTSNLICVQLFQAHMASNWFHCWIEVKVIANNIPSSYLNSKTKQNCDAHQTLDVQYILFCRSNIVQCTQHRNIVHSQSLHHSVGTIEFFFSTFIHTPNDASANSWKTARIRKCSLPAPISKIGHALHAVTLRIYKTLG